MISKAYEIRAVAENTGTLKERPQSLELTTAICSEGSCFDAGRSGERNAGVKNVKPEQKCSRPLTTKIRDRRAG